MNRLNFITLDANSQEHCTKFKNLMSLYAKELDAHQNRTTADEIISKWAESIIKIQGEPYRYLKMCYSGENLIGFLYGKIDAPHHKGYKKVGYGYIMEFYVLPAYRRKGYGRQMFYHLQKLFENTGTKRMYLTADQVTGKPFWRSLGFTATGEISPENNQEIYEKEI